MKVRKTIAALLFFAFFVPFIFSQPIEKDSPVISEIHIDGLKKTKESYVQEVLEKYKDAPVSELNLNDVEITLQQMNLFSDIEVTYGHNDTGNCTLYITVEEKISFIPIPFAMYSSTTGFLGGLMVMDTNAFGVGNNYMVGGIFSGSMQMGVMMFTKPAIPRKRLGFQISGNFAHRTAKFDDAYANNVLEMETLGGGAGFTLVDKFTEHVTVTAGVRYGYLNIDMESDPFGYGSDFETSHTFTLAAGWGLCYPISNEWFMSERKVYVDGDFSFFVSGRKTQSVTAGISIQQPLPLSRLRVLAQAACYYAHNAPLYMQGSQTTVGITIMPEKYRSPSLAGANIGLELALAKTGFATFSVYGLYEYFVAKDFDDSRLNHMGYSLGAKMYLAKIAFPALALGFSHNVNRNKMKFVVAMGMRY